MPRMPLPERRERLITAAIDVIAESGINAATTRAITAKADMPLASFHYAFESHSALMVEVIRRIYQADAKDALDSFGPAVTDGGVADFSLPAAVEAALGAFIDALIERPNRHSAIVQLNFWAMTTPGYEELAGASTQAAHAVMVHLLEQFSAMTGRTFNQPLETIARHIGLLTAGLESHWYHTREADTMRAALPAVAAAFGVYEG